MKIALDTNVLIALLSTGSDHHLETLECYEQHRAAKDEFVIAEHVVLEAFSVLSRLTKPFRTTPQEAHTILEAHFGSADVAPFRAGLGWDAVRHTVDRGYWGGRVYDAVIAMSVFDSGARLLLTWNLRDMLTVAPVGLEIRTPRPKGA